MKFTFYVATQFCTKSFKSDFVDSIVFKQHYSWKFVPFKQTIVTVIILERMFYNNHFLTSLSSDDFFSVSRVDMDFVSPW